MVSEDKSEVFVIQLARNSTMYPKKERNKKLPVNYKPGYKIM